MRIVDCALRKLVVPLDRPIGDSQFGPVDTLEVAVLELETDVGPTGVGFDSINYGTGPVLPAAELFADFEPVSEALVGEPPAALLHERTRPRGGNHGSDRFGRLVDVALWDCCAERAELPLYRFMGGDSSRVPAYASGLAFHHDDETTRRLYEEFAEMGFTSYKVKVGYPTVADDLDRLRLVDETVRETLDDGRGSADGTAGDGPRLMIDANEAFAPKEAIRRVRAYRDAGFDLFWFEDPTFREDVAGIERVVDGLPRTHVCTGEYVGLEGKRELLERGAADVLNVHGLSSARDAATLAGSYGVPVTVGNTPGELGVHAAASLPECLAVEYSMLGWRELLEAPVRFEDGEAVAPEGPGHGLAFTDEAIRRYEQTG